MSKINKLKSQIKAALFNPPESDQMLNELRMENLRLRQKNGDIELFKTINPTLVEKVWKTLKISKIVNSNQTELKELGLDDQELLTQAQRLVAGPQDGAADLVGSPIEGFVREGFLEIEIFKKDKLSIN